MKKNWMRSNITAIACGFAVVGAIATTGCQVDVGGATLPSAYSWSDDVQYFPPASEFKFAKEAAAMQAHKDAAE